MGLMGRIFDGLFGGGRNIIRETAEVFTENREASAMREAELQGAVLQQFGAEFAGPRQSRFDRFMDALNRLPRPMLALGTLGLFVSAMVDPIWFASRMQGVALVPEPLWWLLGAIVSFYFGARHQVKGQEFQRSIAASMAMAPVAMHNIALLDAMSGEASETRPGAGDTGVDAALTAAATRPEKNAALDDWRSRAETR
ncbi:holin family protein [Litorivita sp. NS0012-18]|uniref:holin family protein n=1 Tax=Litorivita sp. NS0012-18 TaxID=3127655 RepID=UPI0031075100